MPKSDTWPGGIAMDSLTSMESAGSCDSVVSINSGFSDDSMEHLSAEERACLMFLEETIESLEMEEDSGLSNDEPDRQPRDLAAKMAHLSSTISQNRSEALSKGHDDPNKVMGKDPKPFLSYLVPTPLLLANGSASILPKPSELAAEQESTGLAEDPKVTGVTTDHTPSGFAVYHEASQLSPNPETSELAAHTETPKLAADPKAANRLPADSSLSISSVTADSASDTVNVDSLPKSIPSDGEPSQGYKKIPSEILMELIPPPSDFRDSLAQESKSQVAAPSSSSMGLDKPSEESESQSAGLLSYSDLAKLRKKASKREPMNQAPVSTQPAVDQPNLPPSPPETQPIIPQETSAPRSPPAVAPKPKKLPSNIILKSHKDSGGGHQLLSPNDRVLMDPQRVRMEALRKLGLLKSDEAESAALSPSLSPKFQRSWASPPSPSGLTTIPEPSPAEPVRSLPGEQPALKEAQEHRVDLPTASKMHIEEPGKVSPSIPKQQPPKPSRSLEVKSATLERSGIGLSSYLAGQAPQETGLDKGLAKTNVELSPGQLRKSRPRPASLGNGKDFKVDQTIQQQDTTNKDPQIRKPPAATPAAAQCTASQKLPRSHGISVMISPHSKSGEDRREALKKLGLIRD